VLDFLFTTDVGRRIPPPAEERREKEEERKQKADV